MENLGLGRREPKSLDHILNKPFYALGEPIIADVEKTLILPKWHTKHNQGQEGSCIGHGGSMMMAIINEQQCRSQGILDPYIRYNPWWLWKQAKLIDGYADTNPDDNNGTTVVAAANILKNIGHVIWTDENDENSIGVVDPSAGICEARWAVTVDEMRTAINGGNPLTIGVCWYSSFNTPVFRENEWWLERRIDLLGRVIGGHCLCVYGASDKRQAFLLKNSWGAAYPEVWLHYDVMDWLIRQNGEVLISTDR